MSKLIQVEIFWEGDGWYFDYLDNTTPGRLGGPFIQIHDAWKQADTEGFQVMRANRTRGMRDSRPTPPIDKTLNAQKEQDFAGYMAKVEERIEVEKQRRANVDTKSSTAGSDE